MSEKQPLGRLESVDLREYWLREDTEFTPWMANPENLKFLGEALGMNLELIETESKIGLYRADIVCRDTNDINTESKVLIENQLEQTDHVHLGQLMTYAAGLEAVRIIWIARKFNEEHRAALDWLNRITDKEFQFFGLEVQLWKIGNSPPAPKFNLVAKPNDWSKTVKTQKQADWNERASMFREIWTDLLEYLRKNYPDIEIPNTSGFHWIRFPVPNTRCVLSYAPKQKKLSMYLLFKEDSPAGWLDFIYSGKDQLEAGLGQGFEWESKDDGSGSAMAAFDFDHLNQEAKQGVYNQIGALLTRISDQLEKRSLEFDEKR
jgi:hypothetical protein